MQNSHAATIPAKIFICGFFIAAADWLFYAQPLGWAIGLYGAVLLGTLCMLNRALLNGWQAKILGLMLFGLVLTLAQEPGLLNTAVFCGGIATLLLLQKRGTVDATLWPGDMVWLFFRFFTQGRRDRRTAQKAAKKSGLARAPLMPLLYRALPPILLGSVFCLLFSEANPVMAKLFATIGWNLPVEDMLSPARWFFWWLAGSATWALLRPRFRLAKPSGITTAADIGRWVDKSSLVISLAFFNLLFAVQNGLDIAFLWSDLGGGLPEGMNYAEYAHAGAYPLIVTALLAGGYVLVTFDERRQQYRTPAASALVVLWILQNIFLVVSSIDRTLLYIETYSLTYLRVAALIWMGLVGLGLALILLRIFLHKGNGWLVNMNALALAATLYACCFVNFDGMIAQYNVRHAQEVSGKGAGLDLAYLRSLGPAAIPALRWFEQNSKDVYKGQGAYHAANELEAELEDDMASANWRVWTGRRQQAYNLLHAE